GTSEALDGNGRQSSHVLSESLEGFRGLQPLPAQQVQLSTKLLIRLTHMLVLSRQSVHSRLELRRGLQVAQREAEQVLALLDPPHDIRGRIHGHGGISYLKVSDAGGRHRPAGT